MLVAQAAREVLARSCFTSFSSLKAVLSFEHGQECRDYPGLNCACPPNANANANANKSAVQGDLRQSGLTPA